MEYPPPRAKVFQPPTGPPSGSNATPFYAFCGPSDLESYKPDVAPNEQTSSQIPKVFKDAMEVRVKVYVEEQKVPLQNEFDSDDSRSCHWVTYASVNTVTDEMVCDENDNIIERQRSKTETVPIGTLRLVPFPHEPHPQPGSKYTFDAAASSSLQTPQYAVDQATVYHDGKEPYIKLGRLAVLPEFRGRGIAHMLIKSALDWVRHNPTFFNPSVEYKSLHKIGVKEKTKEIIPVWNGLMCVHSQADEKVVRAWAKWGFKTDNAMGSWEEEGIKHVGMFMRLNLNGEGWLPLKENKVG